MFEEVITKPIKAEKVLPKSDKVMIYYILQKKTPKNIQF